MSKKRILVAPLHYVIGNGQLGSEYVWAYNFKELAEKDNKYLFQFITGDNPVNNSNDPNLISLNVFDTKTINLSFLPVLKFYTKTMMNIVKLQPKNDIIHHFLPFNISTSFNISAFLNKKLIVGPIQNSLTYKDKDLDASKSGQVGKSSNGLLSFLSRTLFATIIPIAKYLNHITLTNAKFLVAINDQAKNALINRGYDKNKIVVISPGIYTSRVKYVNRNYDNVNMKAVVASYLLDRKKIDITIRAIHLLVNKYNYKHLTLDIIGEGPQSESLNNLVKELDLYNYVNFLGRKSHSEVMNSYSNYDLYINMSMAESFAQTCLESMASGLIVLSSMVGGYEDAIIDGENGFLLNREPDQIAKKLFHLTNNREKLSQISINARKSIEDNYDWEKVIWQKYTSLYDKLL